MANGLVTKDLNFLELLGLVAGSIPCGGLIGYLVAAVRQWFDFEPYFGELVLHFSQVIGIGTAAFIAWDRLLH
jgi:hypothetical protein